MLHPGQPAGAASHRRTTGVAVKHLSNPDSATVGIIGTGYQAPTQLEAVARVRNIGKVKAFSRTPERREAFAAS